MADLNPFQILNGRLGLLRRRTRVLGISKLLLLTGSGVVLLMTLILFLFGFYKPTLITQHWVLGGLIGVSALYVLIQTVRIFSKTASLAEVAARWERQQPELKDGLIAAVYFDEAIRTNSLDGDLDAARSLAHWVVKKTADTKPSTIAPVTELYRPIAVTLTALAVMLSLFWVYPDTFNAALAELTRADNGLRVESGPLVADITLTVDAPQYTGATRRIIPNSTGNVSVFRGSKITVHATPLKSNAQVFILLGDKRIDGKSISENKSELSMEAMDSLDWRFGLRTASGERQIETQARRISIKADKPPHIDLVTPTTDLELDKISAVPIEFSARDDFGISRIAVRLALANDEDNITRVEQEGYSGKVAKGADEIDLNVMDAQPGDRIALSVEVYDNRTIEGPQVSVSQTRYITVRSPEFEHYKITEALNALIEQLLDALASRLETEYQGVAGTLLSEKVGVLSKQTGGALDTLTAILERMEKDPMSSKQAIAGLQSNQQKTSEAHRAEATALARERARTQTGAITNPSDFKTFNEDVISPLEELIIYVESVVAQLGLADIAAMTEEIKAAKVRLKDLMTAYKKRPSDALKARIMRNIRRLKDRMRALQKRMANLRKKLPDEFLNLDGMKSGEVSQGLSDTRKQLDNLEKMMEENRLDDALKALDEMSETLDQLSSALDQDMQELHEQTNPALQKALSELMDQTRDLMKQQEELSQETETQSKLEQEKQAEIFDKLFKEQIDSLLKKAESLKANANKIRSGPLPTFAEESAAEINERVDELIQALKNKRLEAALRSARNALSPLYTVRRYSRFRNRSSRDVSDAANKAIEQDEEIIDQLDDLMKQAQKQMQATKQQSANSSAREKQEQLREAARRLQQKMASQQEKITGLKGEPMQSMESAQKSMQRASQSLQKGQPGHALPSQSEAVSQLKKLMNGLKQASKPQSGNKDGQKGQRDGGRNTKRDKVRIPGADEHDAPAEFRQELMDAMKDKAPSDFKESVKRYYESLVK
ncbi:MAG: DUF4175 family protein [Myxococcota bacterium]|nr:DUF4175 family protein [Myxococcota bacterium]